MTSKNTLNKIKLRNLKRAKLKQREAELQLYLNKKYSNQKITQTIKDINKLKREINNLSD